MQEPENTTYHVHIEAGRRWAGLDLRELWSYRDLVLLLARRDFSLRYKQTILGPLWLIVNPLLTCFVYVIIFDKVAGISTDGIPSILFYLVGTGIWSFLANILSHTANTFADNAYVFGKVYFPRLTMPMSYVLISAAELTIRLLLIIGFIVYFRFSAGLFVPLARWFLIPLVLLWMALLGMGLGLIISSLTTKYRDLRILVEFGLQLWMYATPVVYPLSQISKSSYRTLALMNPATAPVELFRWIVLGQGGVSLSHMVYSLIFTAVVFVIGALLFDRVEKTFMDTV